ncbi:cation transporter [Isachenkonia alkalipeptolytica]|uniref:Cation efflux protein transmembrane domain-containing protein n=1 Tax=Isachenkonia alkalipeptolytica TaxID=2565777 RepID=A0AA43XKV3_9CLOT|nr:cation transporter [Isachenkonia alkalipeptolytica]NBG88713.1 hypothetical protein [Isachenkonia alkalipeptolytica]
MSKYQGLKKEKERTLRAAWMISASAPLVTGFAFYQSGSVSVLADFFRRTLELMVLFSNWLIYKKILKSEEGVKEIDTKKLEGYAARGVMGVMAISFFVIFLNALRQLQDPQPLGEIWAAMIIGILGILVNGSFWWKNRALAKKEASSIFYAQWKLYRAKALMDVTLIIILSSSRIFEAYPLSLYFDPVGSIIMSFFLLYSSYSIWLNKIKKNIRGLSE